VKSGQWTYQVDFKNMIQQNIEVFLYWAPTTFFTLSRTLSILRYQLADDRFVQHPAHTVRKIRRIQLPVEEKTIYSKLGDQKKKKYE
jgi:hypothetical protein